MSKRKSGKYGLAAVAQAKNQAKQRQAAREAHERNEARRGKSYVAVEAKDLRPGMIDYNGRQIRNVKIIAFMNRAMVEYTDNKVRNHRRNASLLIEAKEGEPVVYDIVEEADAREAQDKEIAE